MGRCRGLTATTRLHRRSGVMTPSPSYDEGTSPFEWGRSSLLLLRPAVRAARRGRSRGCGSGRRRRGRRGGHRALARGLGLVGAVTVGRAMEIEQAADQADRHQDTQQDMGAAAAGIAGLEIGVAVLVVASGARIVVTHGLLLGLLPTQRDKTADSCGN